MAKMRTAKQCRGVVNTFVWILFFSGPCLAFAAGTICFACQKEIRFTIYSWTDKVTHNKVNLCEECSDLPRNCYLCSVPVLKQFTELPDGRIICKRDFSSVILDERQAIQICEQVKNDLDRQFIRFLNMPEADITLQLMDRIHLQELFKVIGNDFTCPNVLGCTETKTNEGKRSFEISLLSGLPKEDLMTTCVHEYTHVWIIENLSASRQKIIGKDAVEGFCELLSYLFAEQHGLATAKSNILANHYTRGQIHLFIAAQQQYGLTDIIDWMKEGEDASLLKDNLSRVRRLAVAPQIKAPSPSPATNPIVSKSILEIAVPPPLPTELKLQGIIWSQTRPIATINSHNFISGDEIVVKLQTGPLRVRCLEIQPDSVVVQTNDASTRLVLKLK